MQNKVQYNFDVENMEFISKFFETAGKEKTNKEYVMLQKQVSCKVTPAVSAMKKSADYLLS